MAKSKQDLFDQAVAAGHLAADADVDNVTAAHLAALLAEDPPAAGGFPQRTSRSWRPTVT